MLDPWILGFSLITVAVTIWMGFRSAKSSKSAADFFVAGRSVSVGWNASAISGEYLSAASFMGVAGMVMSAGYDALWYPVCYACGYLFLLLFIAGPLRRFGAYTIPDFAEGRYDSPIFRRIAVLFVLFIGFFYTMPQMKGAGTTLAYVFKDVAFLGQKGLPYWVGVVVVGAVITLNVALGGMKGITLVQAFQYWMKMFAISVPIFVLASLYGGYGSQLQRNESQPSLRGSTVDRVPAFAGSPTDPAALESRLRPMSAAFSYTAPPLDVRTGEAPLLRAVPSLQLPWRKFSMGDSKPSGILERIQRFSHMMNPWRPPFVPPVQGLPLDAVVRVIYRENLWFRPDNFTVYFSPGLDASQVTIRSVTNGLHHGGRKAGAKGIRGLLADNGFALVHLQQNVVKVYPIAMEARFAREQPNLVRESVPGGAVIYSESEQNRPAQDLAGRPGFDPAGRRSFSAKAPPDSTWLNPFGPLTTKAAKAAAAALPTKAAPIEPVPLPQDAPPRLVSWRNVPLAETLEVYQDLVGRTLLPRPNPTMDRLDDLVGGQLSRTGLADRLKNYRGFVSANADGFNPDGTQKPIEASALKNAIEAGFKDAGVTLVPVGDSFFRAVATTNLPAYAANSGQLTSKEWLARHERPYALLYTYSLIIALVCGTAGLPHILVRFYTNPDGVAAKRTTMWVMILIGIFYVFPPVFGVMGRNLMPSLYDGSGVNGTDGIVLKLPTVLGERFGPLGSILSGITCAGAFAAFMSTFSGLLVSMTGALAHDVYGRILRPQSTPAERLRMFKLAAVLIGAVAIGLGTLVENFEINFMVGQAFAIAAASYFPLLFMSVWWRGMTARGAATGMLAGGLLAVAAISLTSWTTFLTAQGAKFQALGRGEPGWFASLKAYSLSGFWAEHPLLRILCEQPAIWAVPLAILLMIVVSKRTRHQVPSDIREKMLVLHAPEALGLRQDYIRDHHG